MSSRFLIVAPIALLITGALFFLMRDLISARAEMPVIEEAPVVVIGRRIIVDPPTDIDLPRPDEVTPPEAPPPARNIDMPTSTGDGIGGPRVGPPRLDPRDFKRYADGGASAIIRPIEYPPCGKGTGEAVIDFVVEPDGSLGDIRVVKATSSCFGRAAVRNAQRWRYRPEVVDGEAIRSGRRQVTIQFVQQS